MWNANGQRRKTAVAIAKAKVDMRSPSGLHWAEKASLLQRAPQIVERAKRAGWIRTEGAQ